MEKPGFVFICVSRVFVSRRCTAVAAGLYRRTVERGPPSHRWASDCSTGVPRRPGEVEQPAVSSALGFIHDPSIEHLGEHSHM